MPAANVVGIFLVLSAESRSRQPTKSASENRLELPICVLSGVVCKVTSRSAKGPIAQSVRAHR